MLRLDLTAELHWLDLGNGVRVRLAPLTTALKVAAQRCRDRSTSIPRATLAIAKPSRLSRNAAFRLTLRDSGVKFAAVDLPEANDLTVGIMALAAQAEREATSKRTKEALGVARSRGVKLGNERRGGAGAGWQGRCAAERGHRT